MMTLSVILLLAGVHPIIQAVDSKTSVATCFVRKIVNDEEVGPKIVIGWRYREDDSGAVTYTARDIHDPAGLLGGRAVTTILKNSEMRMFLLRSDSQRRLPPLALSLRFEAGSKTVSGGIVANDEGTIRSIYFGSCVAKDYAEGSDAIFAKLKSYGAHDFR